MRIRPLPPLQDVGWGIAAEYTTVHVQYETCILCGDCWRTIIVQDTATTSGLVFASSLQGQKALWNEESSHLPSSLLGGLITVCVYQTMCNLLYLEIRPRNDIHFSHLLLKQLQGKRAQKYNNFLLSSYAKKIKSNAWSSHFGFLLNKHMRNEYPQGMDSVFVRLFDCFLGFCLICLHRNQCLQIADAISALPSAKKH